MTLIRATQASRKNRNSFTWEDSANWTDDRNCSHV